MTLKEKVITGLKWSAIAKLLVQLFSWISTFLVIRLLSPNDYGLVAITSVIFTFISIFTVNGFVTALVKSQNIKEQGSNQLFTLSFGIYILFGICIAALASNIANFYGKSELELIIYAMAIITPLNSFCIIPTAALNISMNFKVKAICEATAALGATFVALYSAYSGAGYWALIFALGVELLVRSVLLNYMTKVKYRITLNFNDFNKIISFAGKIQLIELIWFTYNKLDALIIGKFVGVQQLGIYNVAVEIASLPMTKISAILNQVGFSAFSSLKEDLSATRYYLEKALSLLSLAVFPIFLGISAVSHEIVLLFLGAQWSEAVAIIAIFALVFPFRMLNAVIYNFVIAMDDAGFAIKNTVLISVFVIVGILIGVQFGLQATAMAWLISFLLAFFIVIVRVKMKYKLKYSTVFCWLIPFIISCLMWLIIYLVDLFLLTGDVSLVESLLVKILVGGGVILFSYWLFYKDEIISIVKKDKKS
ncbi:lipopolysaccharide biosynthesis protein [Cognaticolwellia mytili]|uniref:lipopolysaccharide biosynthesis protein n=1 Tax=Cognaticolwellia mytili TaxID=1888913 RepID=UPI000A177DD5|nr:lipopolysaccharide biosynthesis protein [Cognaticolwellia mytili]